MLNQVDTILVRHANEITFVAQRWQFATPSYYIPKVVVPFQSTLIVRYNTFEPVRVLNSIVKNSKLGRNQLLN
jgi:hypothetical protein